MKKNKILNLFAIPLFLVMLSLAALAKTEATEKTVSNLNNSVTEALLTNPEILFQKSEKEASDHKVTQSIGAYLPSIDLRAGVGKQYVKESYHKNTIGNASPSASINQRKFDPSITINQKVFDGLKTPYDIQKSRRELFQSTKNVEEAQILIAFNVVDKYISVRRFERLLRLAKENVKVHKSILWKIKKLVDVGKLTTGDLQNVKSRLYDAQAAINDIQGDVDTAYANFKETVGIEASNLTIPKIKGSLIPATVKDAVKMSLKTNRTVIVAKATEAVAQSDFDKTTSFFLPSIDLQFQAKRNHNVGGKTGVETDVTGQIIGTFNILNGGRDLGKRRELRAKMRSAKFKKQKEMRRSEKEIRISYAEMLSARAQSISLRGAVTSKKEVRNIYMKQFDAGTRSFLDILDASHDYFLSKGSLITSDATEDLATVRLLAAIGTLFDMFKEASLNYSDKKHQIKATS